MRMRPTRHHHLRDLCGLLIRHRRADERQCVQRRRAFAEGQSQYMQSGGAADGVVGQIQRTELWWR
eukprot:34624-Eustigmatos_ZCMA.PRE.1